MESLQFTLACAVLLLSTLKWHSSDAKAIVKITEGSQESRRMLILALKSKTRLSSIRSLLDYNEAGISRLKRSVSSSGCEIVSRITFLSAAYTLSKYEEKMCAKEGTSCGPNLVCKPLTRMGRLLKRVNGSGRTGSEWRTFSIGCGCQRK